ncbi:MAG: T9SS type A sorting domain-containing protein [Bacteroidetes bacterium]|nr:T9SS type A sorting domain-containing protein [Bacteroidota bacterium]
MLYRSLLIFLWGFLWVASGNMRAQSRSCVVNTHVSADDFDAWINRIKERRAGFRTLAVEEQVFNVPVIVHIVHDGESLGTGTNISLEQVLSQLEVLNEDFNRLNADTVNTPAEFIDVAGSMNINFLPALVDEAGEMLAEPGIHRIDRNSMEFDAPPYDYDYFSSVIQPATFWNPDDYFNIWVCDLNGGLLGAAQFPEAPFDDLPPNSPPETDGIIIRYNVFGRTSELSPPYEKGRTATHETGHWLGLYHLWGPEESGDNCTEDDYVDDTPNQDDPNNFCPDVQGPTCSGVVREMWENYMDYTWDACVNIFSAGQTERMTIVLENAPRRASLLTSTAADKFDQVITFSEPGIMKFNDPPFELTASSDSGLPLIFTSSDPSVATVSGSIVTIIGGGNAIITANQQGDYFYNAATPVAHILTVDKADQTIEFEPVPAKSFNDPPFLLIADATSGMEVVFTSSDPEIISVSGSMATIHNAGSVVISADQSGDENYNPAPQSTQTVEVGKTEQVVDFDEIPAKIFGDPSFELFAESSSGLPVNFFSADENVLKIINVNEAVISGAGDVEVSAVQEGNQNYLPDTVVRMVVIEKANQTISFEPIQTLRFKDTVILVANASSGLEVSFLSGNENIALTEGNKLIATGVGSLTVIARQGGDMNYHPAQEVDQTIDISRALQEIVFDSIPDFNESVDSITLIFYATSELEVGLDITRGTATIVDSSLINLSPGTVSVKATQNGNAFYDSANAVTHTFCVIPTPEIQVLYQGYYAILNSKHTSGNQWLFDGSIISTDSMVNVYEKGEYVLTVTIEGCTGEATTMADIVTGVIETNLSDIVIRIYPNPVQHTLFIDLSQLAQKELDIHIIDNSGRLVYVKKKIIGVINNLDVSGLNMGVYILYLSFDNIVLPIRFVRQ